MTSTWVMWTGFNVFVLFMLAWVPHWPRHKDAWPDVNRATKYVASQTMTSHERQPSVFLNGDSAKQVAEIKRQQGPDLHVCGSGNLVQTLMKHDLVDVFWLMIYPITHGVGKRCARQVETESLAT